MMQPIHPVLPEYIVSRFCVVGINYRQANAEDRGYFAIDSLAYNAMLAEAKERGFKSLFVLSTCNRAELYAYCQSPTELIELFIKHSKGTAELFERTGFVKSGFEGFEHLFNVTAGFDSQILGDYEVSGQLKTAVAFARQREMIGPIMDRTINFALQASKAVKTQTKFSTGTVSVSYAAVEWLKKAGTISDKNILLFGTGKFGKNIARNLKHYFSANVTVINRTDETARTFATDTALNWAPYASLGEKVQEADIIIVSTNAGSYTLKADLFTKNKPCCILDLSVPVNVDPVVGNIPGIKLSGIDEVSQIMKATMEVRKAEIPQARLIIDKFREDFYKWLSMQRYASMIKEVKDKLHALGSPTYFDLELLNNHVNKTVSELAMNLREKNEKGCQYIHAFNDFLQPKPIQ